MRKLHLVLLIVVFALSTTVFFLNLRLRKENRQLKRQLTTGLLDANKRLNAPPDGLELPTMLKGYNLDGQQIQLDLSKSARKLALLLFDPACKICEENWTYWKKLDRRDRSLDLIPVSTVRSVSRGYMARHWATDRWPLIGLDPALQEQLRMHAVPQTIVVVDGKVQQSWFGLLSDSDVDEIAKALE